MTSGQLSATLDNLEQATADVRDLVRRVDEKVDPLSEDIGRTLQDTRALVRNLNAQVEPLAASLKEASDAAGRLISRVDGKVDPLATRLDESLEAASTTLKQAQKTLGILSGTIEEGAPLRVQLETTFGKLGQAAGSIQALADYLQRNPDALLRGKSTSGGF